MAIVTYNNGRDIALCLRSIRSETAELDIVIADNASSDDTVCQIAKASPRLRVQQNTMNLGFARAANQICRGGSTHDFVLLVNPDTELQPTTIDALIALAQADVGAGIYGGRMLDGEGRLNPVSCLATPSVGQAAAFALGMHHLAAAARFDPDSLGGWDRAGVREVPVLTAGVLLVRSEIWRALKGFDEVYFLYGEDVDFCLRARRLGARPMFTSAATYTHRAGSSSATRSQQVSALLRGKATLYRRLLPPPRSLAACALLRVGVALRALAEVLLGRADTTWREVWRSRRYWIKGWSMD